MAELQTIEAALGVAKLAIQACSFLKRIKDADETIRQVHARLDRLGDVIQDVGRALKRSSTALPEYSNTAKRVRDSIAECGTILSLIHI